MEKIRVVSLFSGIGAMDEGVVQAIGKEQCEIVFASEIDKYASRSYEILHGIKPFGDITKIHEKDIPDHDLLIGGFPCQSFSISGNRLGFHDTRGTLFFDVARILEEKKPKMFLLENVKGLTNHDSGRTFEVIKNTLEEMGYTIHTKVINSKHFQAAQSRERIFIVGFLEEKPFSFPIEHKVSSKIKDILEEVVDEKFYLSDERTSTFIPKVTNRDIKKVGYLDNKYKDKDLQAVFNVDGIAPCITVSGADERKIMIVGNIEDSREHTSRIYSVEGVSCTILCRSDIVKVLEGSRIRKLTPLECFRLQTFPDSWFYTLKENKISNTQLYKMAGNAVTISVIKAIVEEMMRVE